MFDAVVRYCLKCLSQSFRSGLRASFEVGSRGADHAYQLCLCNRRSRYCEISSRVESMLLLERLPGGGESTVILLMFVPRESGSLLFMATELLGCNNVGILTAAVDPP